MNIAIMGPIFVKVDSEGIEFTSESLKLAERLAKNHNVSFISSIGNTYVRPLIKPEIAARGINTDHIHLETFGTGFIISKDLGRFNDDIIQYPSLSKCSEYVQRHPCIFWHADAFILSCEHYELIELSKKNDVIPYLYLPEDAFEHLDDDDEELLENITRLNDDNISSYF